MKFNIFQRTSREVKKAEARLGPKVGPKAKGKWSPDAHASKVKNGANEDENLENLAAYPGEFHPHEAFCEVPKIPKFKDLCLPLAAIIGKALRFGKGERLYTISKIEHKNSKTRENAIRLLWDYYEELSNSIPCVKSWGERNLETCAQKLAHELQVNLVFHCFETGKDRIVFKSNPVNKEDRIHENFVNIHLLYSVNIQHII